MEKILTAAEYRNLAAGSEKSREDSWERSDTDGFLSQWASGLSAQKYRAMADMVDAGLQGKFLGLYDGDRRVAARKITQPKFNAPWLTQTVWLLRDDEVVKFGRRFIPTGEKSRIQKQLGLTERCETAPAWVKIDGSGRGLSGNAWVATYRTGDEWGTDSTLEKE